LKDKERHHGNKSKMGMAEPRGREKKKLKTSFRSLTQGNARLKDKEEVDTGRIAKKGCAGVKTQIR